MVKMVAVKAYSAFGGPETERLAADGFWAGPTDEGEYRVGYIGRHSSKRYPTWSKIPWGAPLKIEEDQLLVRYEGKWRALSEVVSLSARDVAAYHEQLYGIRRIPDTWIFNDERIHGQFHHTTPFNEAQTALGLPVRLEESHGCVHLKPVDIQEMITAGYMRKNAKVTVHRYADRKIPPVRAGRGRPPFEMHFFPGMRQLLVLGTDHVMTLPE